MATKYIRRIEAPVPILIAGWPGMGNVGLGAADYLRRLLKADLVAKIDTSKYYLPDAIEVEAGMGKIPSPPAHHVYYVAEPALLVFEGESQLPGESGLKLANELLDVAEEHKVQTVYTGAAFAIPAGYRHPTQVLGVATDESLKARFSALGVEPLAEGRISGLNGLLLGLARRRGIAAACFLATMPQYAVESPNPRASKAVLQVFSQILNTAVDMTEIDAAIRDSDTALEEFETKVSSAIQSLRQQVERQQGGEHEGEEAEEKERPEPHQLMERVEQLFEEAQRDKTKAVKLKEELDRWGLFGLYEDRFLDLFEKHKPES